ncbi:hypothetical protein QE381_002464 [Microbacterium sp. SORGH_AS 888]|nr:hypothetical protein [Microbacterium sp. SORGH_AS_0888]
MSHFGPLGGAPGGPKWDWWGWGDGGARYLVTVTVIGALAVVPAAFVKSTR